MSFFQPNDYQLPEVANTEGGELFLGIEEDKRSKPRVALGRGTRRVLV